MFALLPLDDLKPAPYNLRRVDADRFEALVLAMRKLGFLLPLYASEGELLSGHRRLEAARALGLSHVPVVELGTLSKNTRLTFNLAFNRTTNDFAGNATDSTADASATLRTEAEGLPDLTRDEMLARLEIREVALAPLVETNLHRFLDCNTSLAKAFLRHHVPRPVVIEQGSQHVVNGIGLVQAAAEAGHDSIAAVAVPPAQCALAQAALNGLSMDYALDGDMADFIRHNAYRRGYTTRKSLGTGFLFPLMRTADRCKDFDPIADADLWSRTFGTRILDFGAEHG